MVTGLGGIGKSALALELAHQVRDRYPDGQIFLDLRGHDPDSAVSVTSALAHLLRSLGAATEHLPDDPGERSALYRSLVEGRRILMIFDNAANTDQVLPLLPASFPAAAIVTCRADLVALTTYCAVRSMPLDVLDVHDAIDLIGRVIGQARVSREPTASRDLVDFCGRLPLALRIAAAKLAMSTGQSLRSLVDDLSDESARLSELAVEEGSRSVRTAFAWSYHALGPAAARAFRRLAVHPGPTVTVWLASALTNSPTDEAGQILDELAARCLLLPTGPATGRFAYHDLVRLYARERADADEPEAARTETVDRILDWYLAISEAASRVLMPQNTAVVPTIRYRPSTLPFTAEPEAVLGFLDLEAANLPGIVRFATEMGRYRTAWTMTYLLAGFFDHGRHIVEAVEATRWGVMAACRATDPGAERLMRATHGVMCNMARQSAEALEHLDRAVVLAREQGNDRAEANAYSNMGRSLSQLHRLDEAAHAYERALAIYETTADSHSTGIVLNNIGNVNVRLHKFDRALAYLLRARTHWRELGNERGKALTNHSLAVTYLQRGEFAAALELLYETLTLAAQTGDLELESKALIDTGQAHLGQGDADSALIHLTEGLARSRRIGSAHHEAIALTVMGAAHLRLGDRTAAQRCLDEARSLRATTPDRPESVRLRVALDDLAAATWRHIADW